MSNKKSKRYFAIREGFNNEDRVDVDAAVEKVKAKATAKFDESVAKMATESPLKMSP